jgi:hypothetical protein
MLKRLTLAFCVSLLMAPALHAAAVPPQALSRMPWEDFTAWAADAICRNLGYCFATIP